MTEESSRKEIIPPTPEEIKENIKALKQHILSLSSAAFQVGEKHEFTTTYRGETVTWGKPALKSFAAKINAELDRIIKEATARGVKVKKTSKTSKPVPKTPSKISESFRDFWDGANLGPIHPEDNKDLRFTQPLIKSLKLLADYGVVLTSSFSALWLIYADVNHLRNEDGTYHVNKYMEEKLGPALKWLESEQGYQEDLKKYQEALDKYNEGKTRKKPTKPERFNRNRIKHTQFSKINSLYTVTKPGSKPTPGRIAVGNDSVMTEEENKDLTSEENKEEAAAEGKLISEVHDRWAKVLGTGKYAPKKSKKKVYMPEEEEESEY